MKYWNYITILLFYIWIGPIYGQNKTLLDIIKWDRSLEIKQRKIDSFLLASNERSTKADLADIYHDLGLKWYHPNWNSTGLEKYLLDAIAHTKKAVVLKTKLDTLDSYSLKRSLFNLGFLQNINGDLYASIKSYLQLVRMGGADDRVKAAHEELGNTYRTIGDFQKAVDHLEMALSIAQNDCENYAAKATTHIAMADNYSTMGHREYADQITLHLQKADSLIIKEGERNIFIRAQIAQLRGNLLLMLENYEGAKQNHIKVLEYSKTHPKEFEHTGLNLNLALVHNSIGVSYDKLGETKLALEHLNTALLLNTQFSLPYENLGDLFLGSGEYEKGLLYYHKAIALLTDKNLKVKYDDIPTIEDLGLSPEKTFLLNHVVTKANGWMLFYEQDGNLNHLNQALRTFEVADRLIDIIRSESKENQSKLHWRGQSANLYMKAVEACYILKKNERAYYFMERNKALLLLEDLTQEEAKNIAQLPQALAQKEFKLKRNIFLEENRLFQEDNQIKSVIDSIKNHISESKYRYEKFIDSLNLAYPEYAKFKKKADILSFNALQSNYISDEQVVLHYILNEEDGYGLLTSTEGPILFQLENTPQLNSDIDSLTSLLSSGISDITTFNKISNTLFNNLIPAEVYNKIKGKQLIIVPDYTLQRIPFETLVVDTTNIKYLIEDTEISYVYSMSLLDHNKGNARHHATQLLGVAPVHFEKLELAELRNSESEILGIVPFFDGDLFLENRASKANFLKEVAAPKIIHLATHADMGDGENPWIAFSDEKMYLKEIYATKNQAEMVVLSACNTLSGNLKRGEGVMSLARGFFYSGAKSVVSSLWPLTDEAGSDIMISFYQNLDKGQSKSKALRQAKLDYMHSNIVEELKHPFYWAGFVVVGDNAPLVDSWHPIWIYIGIVWVLAFFFLFRRKFLKRL